MRCEECGREIKNAELWQLAGDPNAPTSRSMRQLCWDCRKQMAAGADQEPAPVLSEAAEVLKRHGSTSM